MKLVQKIEVECKGCHKKEFVNPSRAIKYKYCSKFCMGICTRKEHNVSCTECGKTFRQRPDRLKRKRRLGFFCSYNCQGKYKQKVYKGAGNPNYKAVFKDSDGYPLQYLPQIGRVKEHRYIAITTLDIDNIPKGYHIHHRDCNVFNNNPDNLAILSISDHKWIHKQFGNATLWAFMNNKVSYNQLVEWSNDKEKCKLLLLNLINQKENGI
jgi:hypothetical protein